MRDNELASLRAKYADDDLRDLDDRFADALGLGLRHLRELREEIDGDLDEAAKGVRWWASLPMKQRVLVGDYLLDCVRSIEGNLVEGQLHYWELLDWWQREEEFIGRSRVVPGGNPPVFLPARTAPMDDLHGHMVSLHTAGMARSLGSALDCLAAIIIGVLPIPRPIMRASFTRDLLNTLEELPGRVSAGTTAQRIQGEFRDAFFEDLRAAGPEHWNDWVVGFRNMLVHRGRRMDASLLVPRSKVPPRAGIERVMPSEPELSQVEAWARWGDLIGCGQGSYVLRERAEETLRRALGAVARLAARSCEHLIATWRARRADPTALLQPLEQWPKIPGIGPSGFEGFAPGSFEQKTDAMIGSPDMHRRLRLAALDTESSHLWRLR
jgi:hypothetical protein